MRKLFLFLSVGIFLFTATRAQQHFDLQKRSEFSIGLEGALPMHGDWPTYYENGNSTKLSKFGLGATLKYVYNINDVMASTFQTGYISFPGKRLAGIKINGGQLPLKAGIRFKARSVYIEPQLGISSFHSKIVYSDGGNSQSQSITAFTYAIGIGALAGKNFDLGFRYEGLSKDVTIGYFALRVAYRIPLTVE